VIAGLLRPGLAEERIADAEPGPDEILGGVGEADQDADGVAPEPAAQADAPAAETDRSTPAPRVRAGAKQAPLIDMLRAYGGAILDEIVEATGWQPHSVRGAMSGALKKRLGLTIASGEVEGRDRVYALC